METNDIVMSGVQLKKLIAKKEAKEARRKALDEYNKHYGVYERCYTGSNAIEELLKDLSETPLAFLADIMRGTARTAGTTR